MSVNLYKLNLNIEIPDKIKGQFIGRNRDNLKKLNNEIYNKLKINIQKY